MLVMIKYHNALKKPLKAEKFEYNVGDKTFCKYFLKYYNPQETIGCSKLKCQNSFRTIKREKLKSA